MKPEAPQGREIEVDRHDHEAGRQLAWVAAFGTILTGGLVVWLRIWSPLVVAVPVVGLAVTVLGFVQPVFTIRFVSGRWSEFERTPARPEDRDPVAGKLDEGTPLTVAVAEEALPDRGRRARWGIAGMLAGTALAVVSGLLAWREILPEAAGQSVFSLAAAIGVGGLILWYRTK